MTRLALALAVLAAPAAASTAPIPCGWPIVERDVATIIRMNPDEQCIVYLGDNLTAKGVSLPMCDGAPDDEVIACAVDTLDSLTGLWASLPRALPRPEVPTLIAVATPVPTPPVVMFPAPPARPWRPGWTRPPRVVTCCATPGVVPPETVVPVAPVPLPAAGWLMLAALGWLGWRAKR